MTMTLCMLEFSGRRRTLRVLTRSFAVLGATGLFTSVVPGRALGQPAPAAEYLPVCTIPNCLNPRVTSKSGVGSANAHAEAKVVRADAVLVRQVQRS